MTALPLIDALGFAASFLTLVAFAQHRMFPMRAAAIGANLFFLGYGLLGGFYPVLVLHLVLLPLNLLRFTGEWLGWRERRREPAPSSAPGLMGWV